MLTVNSISMEFGGEALFDNLSFQISAGERIGLTGKNGAGKSTLLKIILGSFRPTSGQIDTPKDYRIGYLAQDLDVVSSLSVLEEAKKALKVIRDLEQEINDIVQRLETTTDVNSEAYMRMLDDLNDKQIQLDSMGADNTEERIERVLKGLGFESRDMIKPLNTLSGGWQMRVELAKVLLVNPDIVLLDEPTNHLDIESILWLEGYLQEFGGSAIIISHDRAFLDAVTNRTIEIVNGSARDYKFAYSKYIEERASDVERQRSAKKNQERQIKQMERNIERFRAKANKAKFAQGLIRKVDAIERLEVDDDAIAAMKFRFPDPPRSGKVVVKAVGVAKSFGSNEVFRSVDFEILRGEKIAFVGKNGMGKTTLSKCIADQLDFGGDLTLGSNLSLGFFAQHQAETIPGDKTVFETVDDKATGDMRTKVRGLLGAFLFQGDEVNKKVKVLSGGERSRLALALLMLEPHNLLILDEPTNHLDMQSKAILKEAIQHFTGTVIIVSHDRDFLNGLTQRVFEFNHHTVKPHIGDINDFLALKKAESLRTWERVEKESERTVRKEKKANDYTLRKSLAKTERKIEKLEAEINEMNQALQDPEQYSHLQSDEAFLNSYNQKIRDLDKFNEDWARLADQIDE